MVPFVSTPAYGTTLLIRNRTASYRPDANARLERCVDEFEVQFGPRHRLSGEALYGLADMLAHFEEFEAAEAHATRAVDIPAATVADRPNLLMTAWTVLAVIHDKKGRLAGAERDLREVAAIPPKTPVNRIAAANANVNAGRILLKGGKPAGAKGARRDALETFDPDVPLAKSASAAARLHLGRTLLMLGELEEAEVHLIAANHLFSKLDGLEEHETQLAEALSARHAAR